MGEEGRGPLNGIKELTKQICFPHQNVVFWIKMILCTIYCYMIINSPESGN